VDNLSLLVNRTGLVLEIIGTVLLASSLAGQDRVQQLESKIRGYLDHRSNWERVTDYAFLVTAIVFGIWWVADFSTNLLGVIFGESVLLNRIEYVVDLPKTPLLPLWQYIDDNVDPNIQRLSIYVIAIVCMVSIFVESVQEKLAWLLMPIYVVLVTFAFFGLGAIYIATLLLLSPYILAEQLSARFNLQPVLGVLGTIIVLVGLFLQF
jgi:hypothetical protein